MFDYDLIKILKPDHMCTEAIWTKISILTFKIMWIKIWTKRRPKIMTELTVTYIL